MADDHNPRKRRLDAAATTLSKPFKSPMRRPVSTDASNLTPLTSAPATPNKSHPASPGKTKQTQTVATTPRLSAFRRRVSGSTGLTTPTRTPADPEILELQKQQLALQSRIATLRTDQKTIEQALRLESSNKDTELEALIIKWRCAGQEAAEEVFANAQERVTRMGGMAAWLDQSKRDAVRWDDEVPQAQDISKWKDDRSPQDEETDQEFTMGYMLKTLNIEHKTIGYDPVTGNWIRGIT